MVYITWFQTSKESGPKGPGLGLPPERTSILFPPCGSLLEWWSNGVYEISNFKHQISGFQVSGVRCQGGKTKN